MIGNHTCMDCKHLHHSKPSQVFWDCRYWQSPYSRVEFIPDEWQDDPRAYVWLHCHMQPNAPACPAFQGRRKSA